MLIIIKIKVIYFLLSVSTLTQASSTDQLHLYFNIGSSYS